MKTKYQYIHFEETPNLGKKTSKWECMNSKSKYTLGWVYWYGAWRQYVFEPWVSPSTSIYEGEIFNKGCLDDISDFLDQLNKNQRGKWKSKDGGK